MEKEAYEKIQEASIASLSMNLDWSCSVEIATSIKRRAGVLADMSAPWLEMGKDIAQNTISPEEERKKLLAIFRKMAENSGSGQAQKNPSP